MALKTTTTTTGADGEGDGAHPSSHFSEPYRLYTLDVFEYELDSPAALYGTIPVMLGHRKGATSGVFWFNPTETFVDVEQGVVWCVCACLRACLYLHVLLLVVVVLMVMTVVAILSHFAHRRSNLVRGQRCAVCV